MECSFANKVPFPNIHFTVFYDVKSGKLEENAELNRFSAKLKTEFPSDNGKRQQKEECKEKDGIKRRRKEGK